MVRTRAQRSMDRQRLEGLTLVQIKEEARRLGITIAEEITHARYIKLIIEYTQKKPPSEQLSKNTPPVKSKGTPVGFGAIRKKIAPVGRRDSEEMPPWCVHLVAQLQQQQQFHTAQMQQQQQLLKQLTARSSMARETE
ncbi:uncharacterized protein LOC143899329 [Temnothorax americanus]|uniref:uncharacterized protein LOC143899329 n=1 Tax=Temnothorax americanus TaxID=1964332 RepID=UPI0040680C81